MLQFLKNTGANFLNSQAVNLTYEEYYGGSFMLAWDRTKSRDNRYRKSQPDTGSISLNIKSSVPLTQNIYVIIYCTYSSALVLDGEQVITATF